MNRLPLHTLVLLAVFLHSGSCSDEDPQFRFKIVHVTETVTIKCRITNPDQDGVYLFKNNVTNTKEEVSYYYKDGSFTPAKPYSSRLETNRNFTDFSVSISSVHHHDTGVYWCRFNKLDRYTTSDSTVLIVQPGQQPESELYIYLGVIAVLVIIILILVALLVQMLRKCGHYMPKQHASNGVYEEMRGNTSKALVNPAYESTQRRSSPDV